jgi:urease accessory protein UreF
LHTTLECTLECTVQQQRAAPRFPERQAAAAASAAAAAAAALLAHWCAVCCALAQAAARIHRLGQGRATRVVRFIADSTVDVNVVEYQKHRAAQVRGLVLGGGREHGAAGMWW